MANKLRIRYQDFRYAGSPAPLSPGDTFILDFSIYNIVSPDRHYQIPLLQHYIEGVSKALGGYATPLSCHHTLSI